MAATPTAFLPDDAAALLAWSLQQSPATLQQAAFARAAEARYDLSLLLLQQLWQRHPTATNLANLGIAQLLANQAEAAVISLQQALQQQPSAHTEWHLAQALLKCGDWPAAWPHFRARHAADGQTGFATGAPLWLGRRVLLEPEQGYGDMLQFLRFVPWLAAQAQVTLYLPQPLVRLVHHSFPQLPVVTYGHPKPPHDVALTLGDLPGLWHCSRDSIAASCPYLQAEAAAGALWHQRLPQGFRVGVVWQGNPALAADRQRSIPPALLAPLLRVPVQWINLQIPAQPLDGTLDVSAHLDDFADTAAVISQLDLVIAVDTAVAHLAAALARPVWLLNRHDSEWRWMYGAAVSPWYPTLRVFRQRAPGDWPEVIARVAGALQQLLAKMTSVSA